MPRDLIVFAEDWGGLPSSTQHLIRHMAKGRKVVWVNSIGLRRPTLTWRDVKRAWRKIVVSGSATATVNIIADIPRDNFHIVNPRTLPAPRSKVERTLAAKLLLRQLKPVIKRAGLHSPILWTSLPTAVDIAGQLGDTSLVYYCGDDFSALAGVDHETVGTREQELATKADLILVASNQLAQRFPSPRTHVLPHGVDYNLFSAPTPRALDLIDDGRPIAGFYGSISAWLNIDLLAACARRLPHWHFVLIGKAVVDVSALTGLSNVTLLGERAHHELPAYSQHWTAALLPFHDNAQIRACNPLKLREYFAAGRPVISTSFPAVLPFRGLIQIADNVDAYVEALRASTELGTLPRYAPASRALVDGESWAARARATNQLLEAL